MPLDIIRAIGCVILGHSWGYNSYGGYYECRRCGKKAWPHKEIGWMVF